MQLDALKEDPTSTTTASKAVTWGVSESTQDHERHALSHRSNSNSDDINSRRDDLNRLHADESFKRRSIQNENHNHLILPWSKGYRFWWGFSVAWSIFTVFFETYQISFASPGLAPHNDAASILGFAFMVIFVADMVITFNLAYYDEADDLVTDRKRIARNYLRLMFWVDLLGVFPFYLVALAATGEMGEDSTLSRYLSLLRLFRLVRLHRVKQLFDNLQYNIHVSLTALTLTRNFGFAFVWTHIAACVMYFIARQHDFEDSRTWIGGQVYDQTGYERYVTALYWSVVSKYSVSWKTHKANSECSAKSVVCSPVFASLIFFSIAFTTVGYGDFSPVNSAEQIFGMIYMFINMVIGKQCISSR